MTNRKTYYSSSDRTNTQYKITTVPTSMDLDKEQQKNVIWSNYSSKICEINLSKKITQKNVENLLCANIFAVGLLKDSRQNLSDDNVQQTDFIFIDFEIQNDDTNRKVLSYDECIKILEENNLNYILKTSSSHIENENNRLHLFLPLLKPITSKFQYKQNHKLLIDKYFSEYYYDTRATNISRWTYSSKSTTLKYSYEFDKNDIVPEEFTEEQEKIINSNENKQRFVNANNEHINHFNTQTFSMYGFKPARVDNFGIIKYYRDANDKTPNVWYSSGYYSNLDGYTILDKNTPYNVLFSYDDFKNSIEPEVTRTSIQLRLATEFENWFIDGGKKYVITNEGLGKSSTILSLAKKYNFIFSCHTKQRVKEVASQLEKENINHKVIISNYDILKMCELDELAEQYDERIQKNPKYSFKKFVSDKVKNTEKLEEVLDMYDTNIKDLETDNCVRIVTNQKLKIKISKEDFDGEQSNHWYIDQRIIFDEFNFSEWAFYSSPKEGDKIVQKETIWTTKSDEKKYVNLKEMRKGKENDELEYSFLDVLEHCKDVLILTTERAIIEPFFYSTDYKEIRVFENIIDKDFKLQEYKFEKKINDMSVKYILTKSTKVSVREQLITQIKDYCTQLYSEEFKVICNNVSNADYTHLGVKGSNKLKNFNTIVVGTLRTEIEDNIFYYSCQKFFKKFESYMETLGNNPKKEVQNFITQAHLTTQISQSIGRNSGFRNNGKHTIVVLPLLQGNSKHSFKQFPTNYVTPLVTLVQDFSVALAS